MNIRIALLLLLAFPALSAAQEKYEISGAGTVSCGKFLENQKSTILNNMQISWAQGFLSGMNLAGSGSAEEMVVLPDSESINLYLVNYCNANPLESAAIGTVRLFKELSSGAKNAP